MTNPKDALTPICLSDSRKKVWFRYNYAKVIANLHINDIKEDNYPGYNISGGSWHLAKAGSIQCPKRFKTSMDIRKYLIAHGVVNENDIRKCLRECHTIPIYKTPWEKELVKQFSKTKRQKVQKHLENEYRTYERNPISQMKTRTTKPDVGTISSESTVHNMSSYTVPPLVTLFEIIDHKKILSHDQKKSVDEQPTPLIRKHGCQWCGLRKSWNADKLKLRYCSACNHVRYCSEMCQKLDWSKHKDICSLCRRNK